MITVGITGGIASGKSHVTNLLTQFANIPIVDTDQITHLLYESVEVQQQMIALFGTSVITDNNTINKPYLRKLIFSSHTEKEKLEHFIHPLIQQKAQTMLTKTENKQAPYRILSSALLFETQQDKFCEVTITIACQQKFQIHRCSSRDKVSEQDIIKIINAQLPTEEKNKRSDIIIFNNHSEADLEMTTRYIHEYLLINIKNGTFC